MPATVGARPAGTRRWPVGLVWAGPVLTVLGLAGMAVAGLLSLMVTWWATPLDEANAKLLATQLKYGALPLSFKIENVQTVSPTLGLQQMRYGLLAGAIGLLLVVVYCLFYYRALGIVDIAWEMFQKQALP